MENVKCKISFIVPIYDVELYLRKCVDSLLHQDYEDYEIILVDDGSPDNCPAICDEYATRFDKIRVIHQENRGLSGARNTGINAARGEYICFVDSDDYWEENVLGTLMKQIEQNNLDVLRFNYRNVDESGQELRINKNGRMFADYSELACTGECFLEKRLWVACYAWQFIIKLYVAKTEKFTDGIYFEDTDWTPRMLSKAQRVASTRQVVYNYLLRQGSITYSKSLEKQKKWVEDKLMVVYNLQQYKTISGNNRWYDMMSAFMISSILGFVARNMYEEREKYIRAIRKTGLLPLSWYQTTKAMMVNYMLINISPRLFVWLKHKKQ